mgnify:CR=1 FL=1
MEKRVQDLETKLWRQELRYDSYKSASFDPAADEGFQRLDTTVGTFAISLGEVKPHADGVKVQVLVGNLTTATISGGTFKVKWGPRMAKSEDQEWAHYAAWEKTLTKKEHRFTEDLRPGTWNTVTLTLPGIPPERFGHLEIQMETNRIKLLVPHK